jgi:predicted enzyme related to lactoylglutathione lyase
MIRGIDCISLYSHNAKALADFYKTKVGLTVAFEAVMGESDNLYQMKIKKGCDLYIADHSKIKGKNNQPERYIINFEVDDIEKEVARLKKNKVKVIADTYHIEDYGFVATFEDNDGNYFQFVQVKAK